MSVLGSLREAQADMEGLRAALQVSLELCKEQKEQLEQVSRLPIFDSNALSQLSLLLNPIYLLVESELGCSAVSRRRRRDELKPAGPTTLDVVLGRELFEQVRRQRGDLPDDCRSIYGNF